MFNVHRHLSKDLLFGARILGLSASLLKGHYLFTISVALVYDTAHRPTAAAFSRLPAMESSSNPSTVGVGVTTMNIW